METKENQVVSRCTTSNKVSAMSMFFDHETFNDVQRVCGMLISSDLVPDNYRYKPEPVYINKDGSPQDPMAIERNNDAKRKAMANCLIAINKATIMNCDPLTIMQNMAIVYGKPCWSSSFLIATLNACGRFKPLKYKFNNKGNIGKFKYTIFEGVWEDTPNGKRKKTKKVEKSFDGEGIDNLECIAYTSEKGSDEILEGAPVSVEMAVKEGWYAKEGSKWQTMTKLMLMYRSASLFVRTYAPELSQGMYTIEENQDIHRVQDVDYEEVRENTKEDVEREIAEQANKVEISIDMESTEENTEEKAEKKAEVNKEVAENVKEDVKEEEGVSKNQRQMKF